MISWRYKNRDTDTPHEVNKVADGPDDTSAELLWVSSSKTGDYHDNMNSEMFMKCKDITGYNIRVDARIDEFNFGIETF